LLDTSAGVLYIDFIFSYGIMPKYHLGDIFMNTHQHYDFPEEIRTDAAGRLTLGKQLKNKLFIITADQEGTIHLTPAKLIPESELWFFQDHKRVASMARAIEESKSGKGEQISLDDLEDL